METMLRRDPITGLYENIPVREEEIEDDEEITVDDIKNVIKCDEDVENVKEIFKKAKARSKT